MKYLRISLVVLVGLAITSWATLATPAAQASAPQGQSSTQSTSLERGYRTGYSDGYNEGYRDVADHAARDHKSKDEYQRGDRNYNEAWGTAENYRDGYQQGFEVGYRAGYDRRPFDSSIPAGLATRNAVNSVPNNVPGNSPDDNTPSPNNTGSANNSNSPNNTAGQSSPVGGPLYIPRDTILTIELESALSSDVSQRGDRFQARVIAPQEYQGAIVEGRVTNVKRAGRVKGGSELQLSFESMRMDNRTAGFSATLVEVVDMGSRDGTGTVDSEGGVKARNSTRDDISKVGASTGIGAIIGAMVGGGKGAAIGAAIGGAVGTGSVLSNRGKDVRLERGQQLKIRASTETRIQ